MELYTQINQTFQTKQIGTILASLKFTINKAKSYREIHLWSWQG